VSRESTAPDIARLIATTVAKRSLDIRDVVKFRRAMQTQTEEEAHKMEFTLKGLIKSSVRGQKGNREFFTLWSLREELLDRGKVQKMIKEAVWNEKN